LVKDAQVLKDEGNGKFNRKEFQEALASYQQAMDLFSDIPLNAPARAMLASLYCNSAQAWLKLGSDHAASNSARAMAEKALEHEPTNVKARFRRGCAFANMEDWLLARADFERVLRMDPANEAAKGELRSVLRHLRSENGPERSSWEKKAAAAVKTVRREDPRGAQSDKEATALVLRQKVGMASAVRAGALKFWTSKGVADGERRLSDLQPSVDELAQDMMQKVSDMVAEGNLQRLGPQADVMGKMDLEQRRQFIEADAFITTIKQAHASDFAQIVDVAKDLGDGEA